MTVPLKATITELETTPLIDNEPDDGKWETIFDAKRDNNGKGVPIDEFIETLQKILSEE